MKPFLRTLIALWMAAHAALAGAHGDLVRTDDLPPAKSQSSASTGGAGASYLRLPATRTLGAPNA